MAHRNTIQRQLVLGTVQRSKDHPTAEDIYQRVMAGYPGISRATVYRNLGLLADQGQILRVSHLDAADRFDFNTAPHYHFRCEECDRVFDVDLPYDTGLLQAPRNPGGFVFRQCQVTYSGLCPACSGKQAAPPPATP